MRSRPVKVSIITEDSDMAGIIVIFTQLHHRNTQHDDHYDLAQGHVVVG